MSTVKTAVQCFVNDKETLFQTFKLCASTKFEDFSKCWKELKFSLVLYGRRMREFKEWLPACFAAVLPDLQQYHPIDRRVFALFLLYGMYFKQPLKEMITVRVSLTVMQDLEELKHYAIRQELVDILFVWHKMLSSGGIQIVHSVPFYGPLCAKTAVKESSSAVHKLLGELRSDLGPHLAELSGLHSQYESMKRSLRLTVPAIQDLITDDADVMDEFRNRLHSGDLSTRPAAETTAPDKSKEAPQSSEGIGDKRRRLRYRQLNK